MPLKAYDEPTKATAIDGEVVLNGPDGVDVSITPDAAEESARRMTTAADRAREQSVSVEEEEPAASPE